MLAVAVVQVAQRRPPGDRRRGSAGGRSCA